MSLAIIMPVRKKKSFCARWGLRVIALATICGLIMATALQVFLHTHDIDDGLHDFPLPTTHPPQEVVLTDSNAQAMPRDGSCVFHTCFDVYNCGYNDETLISVYIYPPAKYVDKQGVSLTLPISKEYSEVIKTVAGSEYYTTAPERACLLLPSIDLLNENHLRVQQASRILASLDRWNEGRNHLLFNMLPGTMPDYNTALDVHTHKALIAGGGFDRWTYRSTYDVSIPVYNPQTADVYVSRHSLLTETRAWLLVSAQVRLHTDYMQQMVAVATQSQFTSHVLVLEACQPHNYSVRCTAENTHYDYPQVLQDSRFCMVIRSARLGQAALYDVMKFGCIPVIVADNYIMPFEDVIDWKRASVRVSEENLERVGEIVSKISDKQVARMRRQVLFLFDNYFQSMAAITLTTLQIINDRVFPYAARKYEDWNVAEEEVMSQVPLFMPLMPAKQHGFTAVILTYDRLESLFTLIQQVARAPSLAKVLVVWNHQEKAPPPSAQWPKISKPLKVVKTTHNKLSNRFYPYDEIETEAILALDDDIIMLTTDELEFGYRVWREFPDRLVGYPSRLHEWDNVTDSWRYESEWKSSISMVLTGAAFYHKYYSYLYTNALPGNIKAWVDEHFNCEDLAMNFLIANITGKAPIKVAPRQKFKCQSEGCQGETILSADTAHMVERTDCLNQFTRVYGMMPLKTIEFRADPLLFREDLPEYLKPYSNIGNL